jgi:ubiquitin
MPGANCWAEGKKAGLSGPHRQAKRCRKRKRDLAMLQREKR